MLRRASSILSTRHLIVLADVFADVVRAADIDLAGRQEDVDADVDQQAALDLAGDGAGDDVAFLWTVSMTFSHFIFSALRLLRTIMPHRRRRLSSTRTRNVSPIFGEIASPSSHSLRG